jgi:hypothetical protein
MSFYEQCQSFYNGLKTSEILEKDIQNPILVGEAFLEEEFELRTYVPDYTLPNYIAVTARVVAILGSGILFKHDFNNQYGLDDNEITFLENHGFDGNFAKALVHMALYRYKNLEIKILGKSHKNLDKHLVNARTNIGFSSASNELKTRLSVILDILDKKRY